MRLAQVDHQGDMLRVWQCIHYQRWTDPCLTEIPVTDDEQLTVDVIAKDMALGPFAHSTAHKKKQAVYRRLAGGLRNLEGLQYLNKNDQSAIATTMAALERLGNAAEQAKRAKERSEDKAVKTHDRRLSEAYRLTKDLLSVDDLELAAIRTLVLHDIGNLHAPWYAGWTATVHQRTQGNSSVVEALRNVILVELDDIVLEFADRMAFRDGAIDSMVEQLRAELAKQWPRFEHNKVIDELREFLAVEQSDNVVQLNRAP